MLKFATKNCIAEKYANAVAGITADKYQLCSWVVVIIDDDDDEIL